MEKCRKEESGERFLRSSFCNLSGEKKFPDSKEVR